MHRAILLRSLARKTALVKGPTAGVRNIRTCPPALAKKPSQAQQTNFDDEADDEGLFGTGLFEQDLFGTGNGDGDMFSPSAKKVEKLAAEAKKSAPKEKKVELTAEQKVEKDYRKKDKIFKFGLAFAKRRVKELKAGEEASPKIALSLPQTLLQFSQTPAQFQQALEALPSLLTYFHDLRAEYFQTPSPSHRSSIPPNITEYKLSDSSDSPVAKTEVKSADFTPIVQNGTGKGPRFNEDEYKTHLNELIVKHMRRIGNGAPDVMLEVYGNYSKYHLRLDMPTARALIRAITNRPDADAQTIVSATALLPKYKLPSFNDDLACLAEVLRGVFASLPRLSGKQLENAKVVGPTLLKRLEEMVERDMQETDIHPMTLSESFKLNPLAPRHVRHALLRRCAGDRVVKRRVLDERRKVRACLQSIQSHLRAQPDGKESPAVKQWITADDMFLNPKSMTPSMKSSTSPRGSIRSSLKAPKKDGEPADGERVKMAA